MSSFASWFDSLGKKIANLPIAFIEGVGNLLKELFLPDEEFIKEKVAYLSEQFQVLGVATYDMSSFMGSETSLTDITCNIMGQEVTIVRMDIVNDAILKFRAVIRGFIALLLVMYNYDMFMGLIGQQGMQLGSMIQFRNKFNNGKGDNGS